MLGAILKATNSSFQEGMTFCRSIYVKKVMKLLAFIFEQPSYSLSYKIYIITADDYFVTMKWCDLRCNPSCLHSATDNGLYTRFMPTKYHHFACFCLSTYLYVLFMCLYVKYTVLKI